MWSYIDIVSLLVELCGVIASSTMEVSMVSIAELTTPPPLNVYGKLRTCVEVSFT